MRLGPDRLSRKFLSAVVCFLLVFSFTPLRLFAQTAQTGEPTVSPRELFRLERVPVEGGAELITILARLEGIETDVQGDWVPLVTVLRDTLGDASPENDRLRYVWPLTYTRPSLRQKLSGAVPFLYSRVGNKTHASKNAPPPVLDLAAADRDVWNKIFWVAVQSLLLDPYGTPIKASTRSYRQNASNYRKSHIIRALSVLTLYQAVEGVPAFTEAEQSEILGRLRLTDKLFGGLVGDLHLQRYNEKEITYLRDVRGHNWELLRQRAEAESLFFEPLQMPDGSSTHALLWVTKSDLAKNQGRKFDGRFLNIANPWTDKRLQRWEGYSEMRFFDADSRSVEDHDGAETDELIPLALYGLDNPKIPMLLVDFRDGFNPKKREMSRRALEDVTRNILSVSGFGDMPYLLGRSVFDFVTGKRGMDINQPSRLRTYSQLKLLLSLNQSLDPDLRAEIGSRLERVSINPLENDLDVEAKLATQQYRALLAYAKRPDGLPEKLERDRRAEMVGLEHGRSAQIFFRVANVLSFGRYVHREDAEPDNEARLDVARKLEYHTRFLREVARSTSQIDVTEDLGKVRESLAYISSHASGAGSKSAIAAAEIFARTRDMETRRSCLDSLTRMTNNRARKELLRLSQNKDLDPAGKEIISLFLKSPGSPAETLTVSNEKPSNGRIDQ